MSEEVIKRVLSKLDTMLEFDTGIDVNSVEELKTKYDEFANKLLEEKIKDETKHDSFTVIFVDKW